MSSPTVRPSSTRSLPLGSRAKWLLLTLMMLVIVVPSTWLTVLDLRTTERLLDEVERSMQQDAMLFAERLLEYTEQILNARQEAPRTDAPPGVSPALLRQTVIPAAFSRLAERVRAERGPDMFPGGIISIEVITPDTTLVLSRITHHLAPRHQEAIDTFTRSFDLGGLYKDWQIRVACFNEMKATRWRRYLATLIPLIILIGGVVFTTRMAIQEIELSRAKTTFVSNVSHELKTPLAKIQFFNELLRNLPTQDREKQLRYHGVIDQECERLAILVDNVLDFNRIERGQMTYSFVRVPLQDVLHDVVDTFNVLYRDRGYAIDLQLEDILPAVWMDPGTIRQALINLLDNAVKYSDPHTLEVRAVYSLLRGQPAVSISVKDRGIGIPEDQLDLIFSEFYRVESGSTQRASGSGLGLSLVRHIVEAHGGRVDVESRLGEGSTFTIVLPVNPGHTAPRA
ncbi:MAG: hypothetical protein KatS3mg042_1496 [Rhodothermaceae bacterium]|nr:MAG: hypothetical protein KatS3mg042_1496 [Rhodothermaceae bacterium]